MRLSTLLVLLSATALLGSCSSDEGTEAPAREVDDGPNPFLTDANGGKEDTGYFNARGVELEVTLEADLDVPSYRVFDAPAELAQFAVTYLREREDFYVELLAEDAATPSRVEWLVDGEWLSYDEARARDKALLTHFRLRGVNAVVLDHNAAEIAVGDVYRAPVPLRPYSIMSDAGDTCATSNSHITLGQSIYWYLWNPKASTCKADLQDMVVTVDEVLPSGFETYPEYDQLWADGTLSVVVLFGKLDEGDVKDDYNWRTVDKFVIWLKDAGFTEADDAPMGRRFVKEAGELNEVIDIYGPDLFYSVADHTHFANWQKAVSEHEVVMYNGHSVLGSGYAFEAVDYPDFYQIFQVASCLSYEYYVRPVLAGKGDWASVDVLSNVTPTYYSENLPLVGATLARLIYGFENNGRASWQDIMETVSHRLGHSRFGVSGARGNCFSPGGNLCEPACDDLLDEAECNDAGCFWAECPAGLTCDSPYVCAEPAVTDCTGYIDEANCSDAGCQWTACLAMSCDGPFVCSAPASDPALTYRSDTSVAIPDNDPAGAVSVIDIAEDAKIATATLTLDVAHTWTGDLLIQLTHGGATETIWDNAGGSNDNVIGEFETTAFEGQSIEGSWTLTVVDSQRRDVGILNGWSLAFVIPHT